MSKPGTHRYFCLFDRALDLSSVQKSRQQVTRHTTTVRNRSPNLCFIHMKRVVRLSKSSRLGDALTGGVHDLQCIALALETQCIARERRRDNTRLLGGGGLQRGPQGAAQ